MRSISISSKNLFIINQFCINDRQRWLVIHYLALELENVDEMKELTGFVKETKGSDLFISKIYGANEGDEWWEDK